MVLALKMWLYSDSMRKMRERMALISIQRFFKAKLNAMRSSQRASEKPQPARAFDVDLNERPALPPPTRAPAQPSFPSVHGEVAPSALRPQAATAEARPQRGSAPTAHAQPPLLGSAAKPESGRGLEASAAKTAAPESRPLSRSTPRALKHESMKSREPECDPAVREVLESLGLGRYAPNFAVEQVDLAALRLLSEHDLAEMKLSKEARVMLKTKLSSA